VNPPEPPPAVGDPPKFVEAPEHIVLAFPAFAVKGLVPVTFTTTEPVAEHELASLTVSIYVVLELGEALKLAPVPLGDHVYTSGAVPPVALALTVVLAPLHIVVVLALGATVGRGLIVTT